MKQEKNWRIIATKQWILRKRLRKRKRTQEKKRKK